MKTLLTILLTIMAWEWLRRRYELYFRASSNYSVLCCNGTVTTIRNINKYPATFSERNGYEKYKQIGKWRITTLKKQ